VGKEHPSGAATTVKKKISSFASLGSISAMTLSLGLTSQAKHTGRGSPHISTTSGASTPIGLLILSSIAAGS